MVNSTVVLALAACGFVVVAALVLLLLANHKAAPATRQPASGGTCSKGAATFGPVASWAAPGSGGQYSTNSRTMKSLNSSGACIDFLLYGDSITAFLSQNPGVFKAHFGDKRAAALGVGGNTVEQLAWRIMAGNERPAKAPKCMALNIGVNNTRGGNFSTAAAHLEQLLKWLRKAYPSTKLVLMALLPATRNAGDVGAANSTYRAIAQRLGITFAECGQGMDANDKNLYRDGLHPTAAGHDIVLKCLRKVVAPFV